MSPSTGERLLAVRRCNASSASACQLWAGTPGTNVAAVSCAVGAFQLMSPTWVEAEPTSPMMPSLTGGDGFLKRGGHVDLVIMKLPFVAPFGPCVDAWTVEER